MFTGLKVLSLHVNVYFTNENIKPRGDSMKLNFEVLEMQKWNIPMDRAQRVDEKNGVICLFIILTSRVIVIKISKMVHFLYFLLIAANH